MPEIPRRNNTWHFGYKAHIGVNKYSGLVRTVVGTSSDEHDVTKNEHLLTGEEETVNGDARYIGQIREKQPLFATSKERR